MNSSCSFADCFYSCLITFFVTLAILAVVHIFIYFKLVKIAKKKFGIEGYANPLTNYHHTY